MPGSSIAQIGLQTCAELGSSAPELPKTNKVMGSSFKSSAKQLKEWVAAKPAPELSSPAIPQARRSSAPPGELGSMVISRASSQPSISSSQKSGSTKRILDFKNFLFSGTQPLCSEAAAGVSPRAASLSAIPEHLIPSAASSDNGSEPLPELKWKVGALYPILDGKLYWTVHSDDEMTSNQIQSKSRFFFFSTTLHESYEPFCSDFGPVDLGLIHTFHRVLKERLQHPKLKNRPIVYYSGKSAEHVANSAFLMAAFMVMEFGYTAAEATAPFKAISPSPFAGFRDASFAPSTFELSIADCCAGLQRAMEAELFVKESFGLDQWEILHMNGFSMVTNKFVACSGPSSPADTRQCLALCQQLEVSLVIRLNAPTTYDASEFELAGIRHHDLLLDDCSNPTDKQVAEFFSICDAEPGRIAIHCSTGLACTGTLLSLWLMQKLCFTAREAIAWLRLVRPGSVIGPQQHFLESKDAEWNSIAPRKSSKGRSPHQATELEIQELSAQIEAAARHKRKIYNGCNPSKRVHWLPPSERIIF